MSHPNGASYEAGYHTRRELFSQPQVWTAAVEQLVGRYDEVRHFLAAGQYTHAVFTGCGSPFYAAVSGAMVWQQMTGLPAVARPASEVWLSPEDLPHIEGRGLLVVASRSGETSESVRACDTFRQAGRGDVLYIGCYPGRSLEAVSDFTLLFPEAQEESTAQTRAFSTMYLATVGVALTAAGQREALGELYKLAPAAARMLLEYTDLALAVGANLDIDRFYFLGSRMLYGLASELSLKMKEMTLSHSEPFHTLEFRHGPRAMATEGACVVALLAEERRVREQAVLAEMVEQGAQLLTLGEHDADVAFKSGLPAPLRDVLYLPVGQLVALERSLAKGLNPDAPDNLVAYVTLDEQ
jgi:glucosamine--fructose-6-phosphate aminotransferase (isomerizing)